MATYMLRNYTLSTPEAAAAYAAIWHKHIGSLMVFGIETIGVWQPLPKPTQVIALVKYPEGASLEELGGKYMSSPGFRADMEGFDMKQIVSVEAVPMLPVEASPLQ